MAEKLTERDPGLPGAIGRQFPGSEIHVDIFVQVDLALLNQPKGGHRGDRLADGAGLEECLGGNRLRLSRLLDAEAARPLNAAVIDDSDADSRRLMVSQPIPEAAFFGRLASQRSFGEQTTLDPVDPLGDTVRGRVNSHW